MCEAEAGDLPGPGGPQVQGPGELCGVHTVETISPYPPPLGNVELGLQGPATLSSETGSLRLDPGRGAHLSSIWQALQEVTRLKVCILNSWKLESAWSGLMLDLEEGKEGAS